MYQNTSTKGPRLSEKDWYYLQAQTEMPFYYLEFSRVFRYIEHKVISKVQV
jgi:hypothetical protein